MQRNNSIPVLIALSAALVLAGCDDQNNQESNSTRLQSSASISASDAEQNAEFDFYVLALSWSPSYCAANKKRANTIQCNGLRNFSFVVHGLWPQFEKGWPSNCAANPSRVSNKLMEKMLALMPGKPLIRHQWKKHGTCSGLDQQAYFARIVQAYDAVRIPQTYTLLDKATMVEPSAIEQAFMEINQNLKKDAIAVTCDRRRLREVRICLSKNLQFRACREVDRKSCRQNRVVMPPVR